MTDRARDVSALLQHLLESVFEHAATTAVYTDPDVPTRHFESVTDFWRMIEEAGDGTPEVQYVTLRGSLSTLAPALPGIPWAKRNVHREVRREYERIRGQMLKSGRKIAPTTLDALLAFSAGQMVVRVKPAGMAHVYLGLYHSIVRNSIPVFVGREYFDEVVAPALSAGDGQAMEAYVAARLKPLTQHYVADFAESVGLFEVFEAKTLEELAPRYGLEVDGDRHTMIVVGGRTRYLDGDIWVAVRSEGTERVVSRFVNLADADDIRREREGLKRDVEELLGNSQVISEFDQNDRLFAGRQVLDPGEIRRNLYRRPSSGARAGPRAGRRKTESESARRERAAEKPRILIERLEVMMGDRINIHNVGGNVNFKSRLDQVTQAIGAAGAVPEDQRAQLQALMRDLGKALEKIDAAGAKDAERVTVAAERLAGEVVRQEPDKSFLRVSAQGLKEAAEAVAAIAPTVVSTVGKILALLAL